MAILTVPLIPFITRHASWDHHWFQWTPQHPVYESIEAASHEDASHPAGVRVWVWLTERSGNKRQVHYLNDPASIGNGSRHDALFRPIDYHVHGVGHRPRGLTIRFTDKDDQEVIWEMSFAAAASLGPVGAGLTPQSGHGADAFFLVFYRGAAATTTTSRLRIGLGDYTFRDEEQRTAAYRFQAAYSYDVQTVVIRYADYVYAVAHTPESTTPKYRFHPVSTNAEEMCYVHDLSATQALILTTDESGNLRDYTHRNGAHAFCLKLDPPLLSLPSAKSGQTAAYTMTLDQQPSCIEGIVHYGEQP